MRYKFRAECEMDVTRLKLGFVELKRDGKLPDVECEIETDLSLEELRDVMREIEDGHVMVQTVAPAEHYTGERNYSL